MSEATEQLPIEIDVASVRSLVEQSHPMLFLDCREQNEYDVVHIKGSTLLPMSQLEQRAAELDEHQSSRVIVFCHHGGRSMQVAAWLRQRGFAQAQSMSGGIEQWAVEIDPSLPRY